METALRVEHLVKQYARMTAVNDVSFSVEKGEVFALVGPNGAGKSTTLKIIATVLSATEGSVRIFDHDIREHPEHARRLISYLPEEAGAYKNLSGRAYLQFMASLYALNNSEHDAFLSRAETICGLGDRLRDKVKTYSKGMTRKLLLARTLMSNPALAILDEPTSGLDVVNAVAIRNIIKSHAREGMAVLLSSHNMLEIEFLSDRVAIMDAGVIKSVGTASELKSQTSSANLEEAFIALTRRIT